MSAEGQTWSFVKKNFILACNISSEVATPVFFLQRLYHNRYYNYETAMHLKNFKRTAIFSKNFSGTVSDFWRGDLGIYRKLHSSSGAFLKFSSPSACGLGLGKFQKWPSDSGNFLLKSFFTRPMATILFSTLFVKSGDCFENKRHGHSCSEKFLKASGSHMLEKVTEPSQTSNFDFFWIFRIFMKKRHYKTF